MQVTRLFYKNQHYRWSGINAQGKKVTGEIQAFNKNLATIHLKRQGIRVGDIHKKRKNIFNNANRKISTFDVAIFFRQLATLMTAGVPLVQGCNILQKSQEKIALQQLIITLKREIEIGKSLASGLRHFPRYFDELTCHLIHTAEQTGTLDIMLKRIAHNKETAINIKNKIKQVLLYPALIVLVAVIVSIIMLTVVVPRFAELFQNMHDQLPAFTRLILHLSHWLRSDGWIGFLLGLSCLILIYYLHQLPQLKSHKDQFILKLPRIGNIIKKIILACLARNLAITLVAGVPVTEALKSIAYTSGNHIYTQAILKVQSEIAKGQYLHHAMQLDSLFPAMMTHMIKIGEESGMLTAMLEKTAEIYESDIDHLFANLSHVLEPLIIIVLGVLIGGLVIALYLPIFKLGTLM